MSFAYGEVSSWDCLAFLSFNQILSRMLCRGVFGLRLSFHICTVAIVANGHSLTFYIVPQSNFFVILSMFDFKLS